MLFTEIIKENKEFSRAYHRGRFVSGKFLTVYYLPNKLPYNRIGITTGKKIGNAVIRNRARRIIRAAYRINETAFPIGYDMIFVARSDISDKKTCDIEAFIKTRLIKEMNRPQTKMKI